jgi:hypothetical protein
MGFFEEDIREESRRQKTLTRLKKYNTKSVIYNWTSSWSEIKVKTLKYARNNSLAMKN